MDLAIEPFTRALGMPLNKLKLVVFIDTNSPKNVPDSVLDAYFAQTTAIVKSFQFID